MNILLTKLPESITVGDKKYKLKTDFKDWINFELVLESNCSEEQKLQTILELLDNPISIDTEDIAILIRKIIKFYNCGEDIKQNSTNNNIGMKKKIYSFDMDQQYIYVDFIRYYNIDLSNSSMHWWKFRQMFLELPDDSKTKTVMMYRNITVNSKMSKEQRSFYQKMKRLYALSDTRSEEQKKKTVASVLAGHMKL